SARRDLSLSTEAATRRLPVKGISRIFQLLQPGVRGVEAARALRLQETVKPRARVDRATILSRVTDRAHQLALCREFAGKEIFRIVPPRLLGKPGEALFTNALRLKRLEFANWFHASKIGDRQRAVFGRKPLRGRTRARRTGKHEIDPFRNLFVDI